MKAESLPPELWLASGLEQIMSRQLSKRRFETEQTPSLFHSSVEQRMRTVCPSLSLHSAQTLYLSRKLSDLFSSPALHLSRISCSGRRSPVTFLSGEWRRSLSRFRVLCLLVEVSFFVGFQPGFISEFKRSVRAL